MSFPYQDNTAASNSQLGFHPRAGTPGMASPRPSANMDRQEQEKFLGSPYQQSSPLASYPPAAQGTNSYFDDEAHSKSARAAPAGFSSTRTPAAVAGKKANIFKRKPWTMAILLLLLIAAIGGGIGAWKAVSGSKSESTVGGSSLSDSKNSPGTGTSGNGAAPAPTPTITPLARYNWRDPNNVAYGINLGNYLVLERWLDEDWFTSLCADCLDEWNWSAHLGNQAIPTLQKHYDDYIQESDMDTMKAMGFNMIRVTIGYWALIDTPGEPFVNAGQLDRLRMIMEWCHKRGMYVAISMHGMPGSQSGDQSTGLVKDYNVGGTSWFTRANQARSDAVIQALATWITQQQPYTSTIAVVLPVNEPKQTQGNEYRDDWNNIMLDFYRRSYRTLANIGMVMAIHPGFQNGQDPSGWDAFIQGSNMDPNLVIWETHPYPGFFPLNEDRDDIVSKVCALGQIYKDISVPVFFGEWSALSGVPGAAWLKSYWNTQLAAYSSSAGSTFWTWKANNATNPDRALASNQMSRYDFQFLMNQNIASAPAPGQSIKAYTDSLPNNLCAGQSKRSPKAHRRERMGRLSHEERH
ncbi:hypothetical protein CF326_g6872 [Tilletia indica]|uniref:glucan 1,3-beta-glucosidase n=1 Tax=Tilletia indica TaxID=43049 RepID=A0A177TJF8_9BASI|nr:hypothetical protein CF326_g6872 [Tilletia indica]KAE8240111.1 hypothetical protein A4X13_0g7934 [Tilletia indica]